ncbi:MULTISPECIES: acyl-CoA dehydrogenase family protein [unclassified Brevibacterium]|uniref:acyl-CoA dehydrogenase family protein n=1 Tax=unclassified Brevibacterium TaxID=2614124 RepID=UPI001E3EC8E6|nr:MULTISPECIES: acyl-CoA dehydrogenase family protein [unclassified Brevibacterium]MCD1287740.1 acyl-CoA dehydrogenase [Brevibacterium sp. CCUG 69071]MDK8433343.1 acyl-CoA dehydrogenase family protein [Brevibacterium sp. H-BE7]
MAFDISADEQDLVDAVTRISTEVLAPQAAAADESERVSDATLKTLAEVGVLGLNLPEEFGGPGVGSVAMSRMVAAVTEACASTASIITAQFLATDSILLAGTDAQRAEWLPKAAAGEIIGSFGLTEPGAGSNPAEMSTKATRVEGGWHLKGTKCFITNAGFADFIVVYAKTDSEAGRKGISAFIVDTAAAEGLNFNPPERTMGLRGSPVYEFTIDTVVPADALLGVEGEGFTTAMRVLDRGRIEVAAMSLGISKAALDAAVAWAGERRINGKPLNRLQGIAFKLADMYTRYRSAWLLTMDAAEQRDAEVDFTRSSATAKLAASEAAAFIADEALQIHGGYGFTRDFPLERYVRDARIYRIYEGSSEIQRTIIARSLAH